MSANSYCPACGFPLIPPVTRVGQVGFCDVICRDVYVRQHEAVNA